MFLFKYTQHSAGFMLLMCCLLFSSCGTDDSDEIVHITINNWSPERQKDFGNNLSKQLLNYPEVFPVLDSIANKEIYNYVNHLLAPLTQTSQIENRDLFDWEVSILLNDDEEIAFMMPGGHLFISTGLFKFLDAEHELVAIMAHELYYAEKGIMMDEIHKEFSNEKFLLGDIYLGYDVNESVDVIQFIKNHVFRIAQTEQADAYAIKTICPFQYNTAGLKSFLHRSLGTTQWETTRPGAQDRIILLNNNSQGCGNEEEDPTFGKRYLEFKLTLPE